MAVLGVSRYTPRASQKGALGGWRAMPVVVQRFDYRFDYNQ